MIIILAVILYRVYADDILILTPTLTEFQRLLHLLRGNWSGYRHVFINVAKACCIRLLFYSHVDFNCSSTSMRGVRGLALVNEIYLDMYSLLT